MEHKEKHKNTLLIVLFLLILLMPLDLALLRQPEIPQQHSKEGASQFHCAAYRTIAPALCKPHDSMDHGLSSVMKLDLELESDMLDYPATTLLYCLVAVPTFL